MKKSFLISIIFLFGTVITFGQNNDDNKDDKAKNPFSKGTWLIEANTGLGPISPANTNFSLSIVNKSAAWNIGVEGGYFLMDKLAIKGGLGYGNGKSISLSSVGAAGGGEGGGEGSGEGGTTSGIRGSVLSYKIGAKYYFLNRIPLQIDYSGNNVRNGERYMGAQTGYAFFIGKNITIEPSVKYDISLNNDFINYKNVFQFNIGFALRF